jgi:CheY-like chemotaxis protein
MPSPMPDVGVKYHRLISDWLKDHGISDAIAGPMAETAVTLEALATIRELKARGDELALVISDQRMPGVQGTEVLSRSREVYPLARRVMLTAYSDIDAAIKAINEAPLDHDLAKPWDPPEERRAELVVQIAGWQLPGAQRQGVRDVFGECRLVVVTRTGRSGMSQRDRLTVVRLVRQQREQLLRSRAVPAIAVQKARPRRPHAAPVSTQRARHLHSSRASA